MPKKILSDETLQGILNLDTDGDEQSAQIRENAGRIEVKAYGGEWIDLITAITTVASGGSVVLDSATNGNIQVNGSQMTVYDDTVTVGNINDEALDTTLTGKTLTEMVKVLFQCGNDAKSDVVTALVAKGATVTTEDTWSTINTAIDNLNAGDVEITKLNITGSVATPYTKSITLDNPVADNKFVSQVREFVYGTETTSLICAFDNTDATDFEDCTWHVVFDGTMHLPTTLANNMTDEGVIGDGELYSYSVTQSNYKDILGITTTDGVTPQTTFSIVPNPYIVKAVADIDLSGIQALEYVYFTASSTNGGKMLLAMSVDGGVTYKAYNTTTKLWVTVNTSSLTDFADKGMTKTVTDALGIQQLEVLRNGSGTLRFAYYLSAVDNTSTASTDSISIKIGANGSMHTLAEADYDVVITNDSTNVDFKIYKNGTFTFNYLNN